MAVHGFRGAIGRLACGLPVGLRLQSYQTLPEKRRTRWAYLPNPGWLWRFFAHGFGPLATMPARRGVHVAAARGLAPLSAFCPTNAIFYICQMLFKHPDRLSFLVPAALFRLALLAFANGPGQSVCQWRRFVLPPGGSLGFGGCSPAPRPAWSGLPWMWLLLMKMYGFCQCRHWPWLSARAAVVWVMCRFAV